MIPLRDENPSATVPILTRGLILVNTAVFLYEIMLGSGVRDFITDWGMIPLRITLALQGGPEPLLAPGLTVLSSMFIHGGWLHLIGNMWYLWIFGDNVEDRLGHARYLLFYVIGGAVAALLQFGLLPGSRVPTVGASGAVAAVLGAYAVTYPRARVMTLIPFFPFFHIAALPALLVLGLWFVFQFFSGAVSIAWARSAGGGIAWWAHVGGFVFGAVVMKLLSIGRRPRDERIERV